MATILYIHGFLSSPESRKAQQTKTWLTTNAPHIDFVCPQLSSYPSEAIVTLRNCIDSIDNGPIYAIGSSLGGFWSTYLVENDLVEKAVLVNPGVLPQNRFHEFIGRKLKSYYTEDEFTLTQKDVDDLAAVDVTPISKHERYWLMVQTEDETLDYRLAVDKYQGCKQLVEEGGNHSFEGYEAWLPKIMEFFSLTENSFLAT